VPDFVIQILPWMHPIIGAARIERTLPNSFPIFETACKKSNPEVSAGFALIFLTVWLLPFTAGAHQETGTVWGFTSGFVHPLTGLDHITAMVAVGLWGAFLGAPAMWVLPVVFPVVMAFGGALGVLGVPLPGVETGIALSSLILGIAVAFALRPPLWVAALIVGSFAIFHGHAHGAEMPKAANAMTYAFGFVIATGMLHLCGIAFGLLVRWSWGKNLVRLGGAAIALVGVGFLFHFISA
jgi:urease accessory protein